MVGVDVLTTAQAARVAGIDERNAPAMVPRLVGALTNDAVADPVGREVWSAGEVIAIAVVRALDPHGAHPEQWATGAARVGAAHERGLCPAYFVTAGGADYSIVLDDEGADIAAARVSSRAWRPKGTSRGSFRSRRSSNTSVTSWSCAPRPERRAGWIHSVAAVTTASTLHAATPSGQLMEGHVLHSARMP